MTKHSVALKLGLISNINSIPLKNLLCSVYRESFPNAPRPASYHSSGVPLWGFVSARPDTCPEHAGSDPLCTRCAASSPLRLWGGAGRRVDINHRSFITPCPLTCSVECYLRMLLNSSVMFRGSHAHTGAPVFCACYDGLVITPVFA